MYEVGANPDWDEIRKFTMNTLGAGTPEQATYFSAQSHVLVAQRLDGAVAMVQEYMMNAAQHVGKVSERGTSLLVDASDRATQGARIQAEQADRHARSLKSATWMLTFVTTILAVATVALVFYTRQLAVSERTPRVPVSAATSPAKP